VLSRRKQFSSAQQSAIPVLHKLRRAVVAAGVAYAGTTLGYALFRPLLGDREGWIELADDLEPWAYAAAPGLGLLGAACRSGALAAASGALAAGFAARWGHRFLRRAPDPGDSTADLKIMTFNTLAWQREGNDLATSVAEANPDIVAFQEIGPRPADHLATMFADRFPHHYITRSPTSNGSATLSRYPLLDPVAFRVSDRGHWWQRMIVDAPFGRFTLFNIHTKIPHVRTTHNRFGLSRLPLNFHTERRSQEIRKLTDMLDRVAGPVIVCGDFNMTERSQDYRHMARRLRDSYKAVGVGLGHTFPTWGAIPRAFPAPWPTLRLDYVWHSEHFAPAWAYRGDAGCSDHHPVVACFHWIAEARDGVGTIPLAASTV
jgi:endonuclease/exonuclease/phosphatase (EEP) superfamily protein YafD